MSKRKKPLLKSCCAQEEVGEKSGDRKFGLRQTRAKSFNAFSNQGDGKKIKTNKDNGITNQSVIWFVTCENTEGIMDIEKLKKGENCIECQGLWFTPPAFEEFAGRGACKKWKNSICCEGIPLTHWFAKGILSTTGYQRRGAEPTRKIRVSSRKVESMPTKSVHEFQGSKRSKYKRTSTSMTQKSISPAGFTPSAEAGVQPVQDPEESHMNDDHKHYNSDEFLQRDQKNRDDPDERNYEHGINSGDAEDENKPDNGLLMLADADYHSDAKERHEVSDGAEAEEQEMKRKTKVIIRRLSERWRACKAKRQPKGTWCEPLEESAHAEEAEGNSAVADENLGASAAKPVVGSNGDEPGVFVAPANLLLPFNKEINEKDTDEAKPDHDEAALGRSETCIQVSEKVEDGAAAVSDGADVEAMAIDQMKKEKLKIQLKVLKLQEEYYTLMLNNLKK